MQRLCIAWMKTDGIKWSKRWFCLWLWGIGKKFSNYRVSTAQPNISIFEKKLDFWAKIDFWCPKMRFVDQRSCILLPIFSGDIENIKSRVRAATRMLIIIVSCYLCTNIVDVFIATWEYVDAASLSEMSGFYTVATDVSSLLSVTGAALRLPIYIANDDLIRREVIGFG